MKHFDSQLFILIRPRAFTVEFPAHVGFGCLVGRPHLFGYHACVNGPAVFKVFHCLHAGKGMIKNCTKKVLQIFVIVKQ